MKYKDRKKVQRIVNKQVDKTLNFLQKDYPDRFEVNQLQAQWDQVNYSFSYIYRIYDKHYNDYILVWDCTIYSMFEHLLATISDFIAYNRTEKVKYDKPTFVTNTLQNNYGLRMHQLNEEANYE